MESFSTFIHHSSLYDVYYLAPFNISEKYSRRLQEEIGFLTGQLTEKIQEHELIKTNQAEKSVQDVLDNCIERVQNNSLKSDRVTSLRPRLLSYLSLRL